MLVRLMICELVLVGCSFQHGSEWSDAAVDTDVGDDRDGDGIKNQVDNCPDVANAEQRDHDADGRGDACDLCPHVMTATDFDSDGDGIGDECDPRPMTAGDKRVFWEGFYDDQAIAGWNGTGTWTVASGAVRQGGTAGEASLTAPATFQRPYIAAEFRIEQLATTAASIGMCSGMNGQPATQYYCCIMRNSGPLLSAVSYSAPALNQNQGAAWTGSFLPMDRISLVESNVSTNLCTARQSATIATATSSLASTAGAFRLYTRDASASFDYVFVVEIGP